MVYQGTSVTETIAMRPMNALNETHFIELEKAANAPMFVVTCCCDEDWVYVFNTGENSDYERVKHNIMAAMFECDTMEELLETLSEVFEDGFEDILVQDECNGCCGQCDCFN